MSLGEARFIRCEDPRRHHAAADAPWYRWHRAGLLVPVSHVAEVMAALHSRRILAVPLPEEVWVYGMTHIRVDCPHCDVVNTVQEWTERHVCEACGWLFRVGLDDDDNPIAWADWHADPRGVADDADPSDD